MFGSEIFGLVNKEMCIETEFQDFRLIDIVHPKVQ